VSTGSRRTVMRGTGDEGGWEGDSSPCSWGCRGGISPAKGYLVLVAQLVLIHSHSAEERHRGVERDWGARGASDPPGDDLLSFVVGRSSFFVVRWSFLVLRSSLFVGSSSFFVVRWSLFVSCSSFFVGCWSFTRARWVLDASLVCCLVVRRFASLCCLVVWSLSLCFVCSMRLVRRRSCSFDGVESLCSLCGRLVVVFVGLMLPVSAIVGLFEGGYGGRSCVFAL